ncbi:MAG: pilus assembly protein PilM [Bdellovibrionaceae bacterium]|nr:pilus assembly protein PilM [Pseudobdellovibrionaceae bacterium]
MKSVGIDIGTHQVKVVEVQTLSKGFQLTRAFTKNLSRATGTDLELEIIEFLRELSTSYDPASTRFVVGLRQDKVSFRNKTFPFADRQRIQKTLPFELEEDLPFSVENAIFDGKIVRVVGTSAEVLAAAAPKIHIAHLLDLMKSSNIEPSIVSTEGTAFANLFERWGDSVLALPASVNSNLLEDEGAERQNRSLRVALNIGHTHTLVCAFDGSALVGVRTILWGGKNIADAIVQKYNLPPAEAQKEMEVKAFILTTKQDASFEAKIFSDLISKGVRDLVRDLQLSLLELKAEFGGEITEVMMTGGASGIQGLGPFLTQHLEVPVNKLNVLEIFPNVNFERSDEANLRYGVAIGLAIDGLRKPRNPALNFMKNEFARQKSLIKDLWTEWGTVVKAAMAASVLFCIWALAREQVAFNLDEVSSELLRSRAREVAGLSARQANEAGVRRYIQDNRRKIADIRMIENLVGMNSAMDVMSKITTAIPDRNSMPLQLTEFAINDANVSIAGYVRGGKNLVDLLQRSLTSVSVDGRVHVDGIQPAVGQTGFRMSFRVDRNLQKVTK